jgi:hypothetical protein
MASDSPPNLSLLQFQEQAKSHAINQITLLEIPVEWMRWCDKCQEEKCFYADRLCAAGLIGKCSGCGDESLAPYTRSVSEVA